MTPLERAAKAAAEYYGEDWEKLPEQNPVANGELDRSHYIETVRAVLTALRQPSEAMREAVISGYDFPWWFQDAVAGGGEVTLSAWQRMIDAVIEDRPDFIAIPRLT